MQPFLKSLRPQIIKTIEERFHEGGGEDNRDHDERPINGKKANQPEKIPIKHKRE